jgi:hypothetical protein
MSDDRERLLARLSTDLIGPQHGEDEEITAWPSDQYIAGILYPASIGPTPEDDDAAEATEADDGSPGGAVPTGLTRRPSVMGVSFALEGDKPSIHIRAHAATYVPRVSVEDPERADSWKRQVANLDPPEAVEVREGLRRVPAGAHGLWWIRGLRHGGRWQVTVALENTATPEPGRIRSEPVHLFQVGFEVDAAAGARIVPRHTRKADVDDPDSRIHNLIYRTAREWAVGHTCGATWELRGERTVVSSEWIPRQRVDAMSPLGHGVFREESAKRQSPLGDCFSADALAHAPDAATLERLLGAIPAAYECWQADVEGRIQTELSRGALTADLANTARENLAVAANVTRRIRTGIAAVTAPANVTVRRAFQLAQEAMLLQRRWSKRDAKAKLEWRPFQLAFQLLALAGLASPRTPDGSLDPDRDVMDLLWFPTGGGKTEAYLALTAFTLILRRLRERDPDQGAGVAVLMRYTLRLLTVQQFERASRLVLACEHLRRELTKKGDRSLGSVPFSIGLWVGSAATPNKRANARNDPAEAKKAQQLARCPACNHEHLRWDRDKKSPHYSAECPSKQCPLHGEPLPVHTIDEDVYEVRPGLVIGTIDKFAQIVRNPATHNLFDGAGGPPELIIQDELHLISGPLGTVAGIYEAAVDALCTRDGVRPKVVGSTATIRRASDQVRQLFDREVLQFPPPVLDAEDSCFAVVDRDAPGRLYAGVTTAGRSPKFVLQATCASLLQGASEDAVVSPAARDWYWTLVAYFNSLRELGGALVMMQDDVLDSMKNLAGQHGTAERSVDDIIELTSRVPQADIPGYLVALEKPYDPAKGPQSQETGIVLATNMISVGVDIPRLGLMAVNGQPKTMAEYIQATSRVGRGDVPGLVVTVYNVGRPRDRSHYEAFRTWHQTIYREVEATSVTPFAPRARDRALHAALVALARHRVPAMLEDAEVTPAARAELDVLVDGLLARVEHLDPSEVDDAARELRMYLDEWEMRGPIEHYWSDRHPKDTLLVSAEVVAEAKAVNGRWLSPAKPTPNSMRDVEAQVQFRLTEKLS